jgi:hypothetical protein
MTLTKLERAHEVPFAGRPVAMDFNDWVHDIVLREFDQLLEPLKKFANFRVPSASPKLGAFPDTVLGEYRSDSFWIVVVVTDFTVSGLKLLYRLDVFQTGQPPLDSLKIHILILPCWCRLRTGA